MSPVQRMSPPVDMGVQKMRVVERIRVGFDEDRDLIVVFNDEMPYSLTHEAARSLISDLQESLVMVGTEPGQG